MRPDWQNVRRLLGCFVGDTSGDMGALEPALQTLRQLPETELVVLSQVVLTPDEAQWSLVSLTSPSHAAKPFTATLIDIIEMLRVYCFDAAIIFTPPYRSPYTLGYLCYLAGIPIRIGQSQEFGGSVLSCVTPLPDPVPLSNYYLHLLNAAGLYTPAQINTQSNFFPSIDHAVTNSNLAHSR